MWQWNTKNFDYSVIITTPGKFSYSRLKSVTNSDRDDMDINGSNKNLSSFIRVYGLHNNSTSKCSQSAIKIQWLCINACLCYENSILITWQKKTKA